MGKMAIGLDHRGSSGYRTFIFHEVPLTRRWQNIIPMFRIILDDAGMEFIDLLISGCSVHEHRHTFVSDTTYVYTADLTLVIPNNLVLPQKLPIYARTEMRSEWKFVVNLDIEDIDGDPLVTNLRDV